MLKFRALYSYRSQGLSKRGYKVRRKTEQHFHLTSGIETKYLVYIGSVVLINLCDVIASLTLP